VPSDDRRHLNVEAAILSVSYSFLQQPTIFPRSESTSSHVTISFCCDCFCMGAHRPGARWSTAMHALGSSKPGRVNG
jgi:hypothetical protein